MIIKKLSLQIRKTEFNYFLTLLISEMLSRITRIIPRNLSVTRCRAGYKNYDEPKSSIKKRMEQRIDISKWIFPELKSFIILKFTI